MPKGSVSPGDTRTYMAEWARAIAKHPIFIADISHAAHLASSFDLSQRVLHERMVDAWQSIRAPSPMEARDSLSTLLRGLDGVDDVDEWMRVLRAWRQGAPDEDLDIFLTAYSQCQQYERWKPSALRNWLKARYQGLWSKAPLLMEDVLDQTLEVSLERGRWDAAYLIRLAGVGRRVLVDVFEDAEHLAPAWRDLRVPTYTDYSNAYGRAGEPPEPPTHTIEFVPRHTAIVLHIYGADEPEIRASFDAALKRAQPYIKKPLGTRPTGHPKDYSLDVKIYAAYRAWAQENGEHPYAFASWYPIDESGSDREVTARRLRRARWLQPSLIVPGTAEEYLAVIAEYIICGMPQEMSVNGRVATVSWDTNILK